MTGSILKYIVEPIFMHIVGSIHYWGYRGIPLRGVCMDKPQTTDRLFEKKRRYD